MNPVTSVLLLLAVQLIVNQAAPADENGPPDPKRPKICFFSKQHESDLETVPRPTRSKVSTKCDETAFTELSTLAQNPGSHGAPNELSLVLARGAAVFLEKDDDLSAWKGKHICNGHLNELSRKYKDHSYKHIARTRGDKVRCGFPAPNHHRNADPSGTLTFDESKALLSSRHFLLHPGTPLCQEHHGEVRDLVNSVDESMDGGKEAEDVSDDAGQCEMEQDDPDFTPRERTTPVCIDPVKKLFHDFARGAGVTRVEVKKTYSELKERGKRYRHHAATVLSNVIIEMLAESEEEQDALRAAVKTAIFGRTPTIEDSKMIHDLLTTAAMNYNEAKNAQERVQILSLYARDIPYRMMVDYVEGLSERLWNQAKKMAIDKKSYNPPDHSKERYDPIKVNFFISFLTSPHILVGLPWGIKHTKDSHGHDVELPNVIMRTATYETIRLYEQYMDESGRSSLKLSNSSTYRILSRLPTMKSRAISCALLDIGKMLDELQRMSLLDHAEASGYKTSFHQIKDYLRGNFKMHAKPQSYFSDHCLKWALSDPTNTNLQAIHNHAHQKRCPQCKGMEKLNTSLVEWKNNAKGPNALKLAEFVVEYNYNAEKIYELKAHHARSVFASLERERIIAGLEQNQCFITLDFAQKWLPAYYRESQKMYFGKSGLSWHLSHCLCNITNKMVQHSFVHLLNEQDQDSTAVIELVKHLLKQLKLMGITDVHLRSDNAAYYHSSASISSIPDVSSSSKVNVISWSFSEAQSGKSSSDRVAALVKRKMRHFISKEHDVDTVDRMFDAIIEEKQLRGLSVYVGVVNLKEKSPTKIAKISEYGHFDFRGNENVAYRFHAIGDGVKLPELKPIKASFTISRSGGKQATKAVNTADRAALAAGTETVFWYLPPEHHARHHHHEINDEDDEEATGRPSFHNPAAATRESLYYCRDCGASFIRYSNLIRHIESGKHKVRPDRISLFDKALGLFKRALEDVQQDHTLSPLNEAINQIRAGNDPPLPMGWAIRAGKKGGRLPEKAKQFITKLFNERRNAKVKLRTEEAWNNMRFERSIAPEERMTREQIKNLINTLAQKEKTVKKKAASRATRALPKTEEENDEIETDEDEGVFYEEVEVSEDDVTVTDDEMHIFLINELEHHFDRPLEPVFANPNIGDFNFE